MILNWKLPVYNEIRRFCSHHAYTLDVPTPIGRPSWSCSGLDIFDLETEHESDVSWEKMYFISKAHGQKWEFLEAIGNLIETLCSTEGG